MVLITFFTGIGPKLAEDIETSNNTFENFLADSNPVSLKFGRISEVDIKIFKDGDKHDFNNYRPISLLSSFSKLLEKIVASQLVRFLNSHNILYKHQYGFRANHNTSQPVFHFTDKIYQSILK